MFGPIHKAEDSHVVAVVIDEETYGTAPFAGTPQVAWTPYLAHVLDAIVAADPKVIGLDLVYPASLDRPGLVPGYDKPLLKSFLRAGRRGFLVLGEVKLSRQAIRPARGQIIAVGGIANLRPLNLVIDIDDVVRRYRTGYPTEEGGRIASFGAELAKRAGTESAETEFLINYNTGADDIPSYGLSDLFACAQAGRGEFFDRFRDKIVIVGTALDVEDRRVPAKRFAMGVSDPDQRERCIPGAASDRFGATVARHSMPGLYIHAAAVNNLLNDDTLHLQGGLRRFLMVAAAVLTGSAIFFLSPPLFGALALPLLGAAAAGLGLMTFRSGVVVPLITIWAGLAISYGAIYAYRFFVEDRNKRWIQHAFRHYLAPALVDKLVEDESALALGGDRRVVTVFFSDLAGFTTFSETFKDRPEELVEILNDYLTVVTDVIERHGGYVDKFIGDAVMAIWGAPLPDAAAETNAVRAALAVHAALAEFNKRLAGTHPEMDAMVTRIGINTGPAFVGNMGSRSRLNYTVGGDTVNLGARLEGANKEYGTMFMVGDATATGLDPSIPRRRLDFLAVKGKSEPIPVFEPYDASDARKSQLVETFEKGYDLYLARRFDEARAIFVGQAGLDPPSALYAERCTRLLADPPPEDWDGSYVLETK
jgi:class 3 adenylate cyclase